ncbi:hypothetical protein V8G54_034752 [Vigna mungo]|uniref:Uncharacterized protein n=1 Tax=Vigna mungo TaxID=3915 RepID=A0AAQ3R9E8_VIGMU
MVVQNYLKRTGRGEWARQVTSPFQLSESFNNSSIVRLPCRCMFREATKMKDDTALMNIMSNYGEEVVTALGSEVDRLEKEIQNLVPGIRHVDIEAHNPPTEFGRTFEAELHASSWTTFDN